jgi:hypothetical protein
MVNVLLAFRDLRRTSGCIVIIERVRTLRHGVSRAKTPCSEKHSLPRAGPPQSVALALAHARAHDDNSFGIHMLNMPYKTSFTVPSEEPPLWCRGMVIIYSTDKRRPSIRVFLCMLRWIKRSLPLEHLLEVRLSDLCNGRWAA